MTTNNRREANRERINRLEAEAQERERVIGNLKRRIETQQKLLTASERERSNAAQGYELMCKSYCALVIRMALAYGEDVMDEERGKSIGKRLRLPVLNENMSELIAKWQSKAWTDEAEQETIIAVGLRDDPDDHKTDAELEAEAEAYREAEHGA